MPRLSKEDWKDIRKAYENGKSPTKLAGEYHIAHTNIYRKINSEKWVYGGKKGYAHRVTLYLIDKEDSEVLNKLERWAKVERRSLSAQILYALEEFVYRHNL